MTSSTVRPPPPAVVLDFDLTLADSTTAAVVCVNHALQAMGHAAVDRETARRTIGPSLVDGYRMLTDDDDPDAAARYHERFVEHADRVMVDLIELFPGVEAALRRLRGRDHPLGIVSTKYRYRIERILDRLGARGLFDAIVGGEDVTALKPDPDGLHRALAALGRGPEEAIYVGDHPVDAEAASRAGVRFVGVLTGTASRDDFERYPHLAVLEGVPELPELLGSTTGPAGSI